jgi:RHS repeat-associated protein
MRIGQRTTTTLPLGFCALLATLPLAAQQVLTNPPDLAPAGGLYSTGAYALTNIESVNSINGNVNLRFPLAHLPPGPGGFSASVDLIYNSAIYDAPAVPYDSNFDLAMNYQPSTHGGGWSYGYKYTLWAQPRISPYYAGCGSLSGSLLTNWYKNFLRTPDGSNHALYLISSTIAQDPNTGYSSVDFSGHGNPGCGVNQSPYVGTLVFATGDSSFIRVEANTSTGNWVAYLPDGSQANGPIVTTNAGAGNLYGADSAATQIKDRNGNTLTINPICPLGQTCTENLTDGQGRIVSVNYETSGSFVDKVTWQGPNGGLTTTVNWALGSASNFLYYCRTGPDGSLVTANPCNISAASSLQVSSIQLPQAASGSGGNAVNFNAYYIAAGSNLSWGELHTLTECVGVSPTSCAPEWSVYYGYTYDSLSSTSRPPGIAINPIATKQLGFAETLDTAPQVQLTETTNYSLQYPCPAPITASNCNVFTPLNPGPLSTPNTITKLDDASGTTTSSATTIYLTNLCGSTTLARDACSPVMYKTVNPDGSITEVAFASNQSLPVGVPPGTIFNPYIQWTAETHAGLANGRYVAQDANGNRTNFFEYDWVPAANLNRNPNGTLASMACPGGSPAPPCPVRSTLTTYYSQGLSYWNQGTAGYLRAPHSTSLNSTVLANYIYDNNTTTANLTQLQRWDSFQSQFISSSSTYLTNGNLSTQTDPNGIQTTICYSNNLYPVKRIVAATPGSQCPNPTKLTEGRTFTYTFDSGSGVLTNETDADNSITTSYVYDNLSRQTTVTQTGGALSRVTSTTYDDRNLVITVTQDDTALQKLVTVTDYDALGRARLAVDGAGDKVEKAYRFGTGVSYELESNPYGVTLTDSMTQGFTLTTRDPVGRVKNVQHYQGANPPSPWGTSNPALTGAASMLYDQTTANCSGPTTQVTDEANHTHTYCPDGLGRLLAVTEPNGTVTNYTYDLLNNLITVDVKGQTGTTCTLPGSTVTHLRCFNYSTLSRLLSAANPESGTVSYVYDNNGNVTKRTDANNTVTNLSGYDGLNRVKTVSYTANSPAVATPSVCYTYDQDLKGALTSVSNGQLSNGQCTSPVSTTAHTHDSLGRIATSTQTTAGQPYSFTYAYTLTDQLTQITYPSGRKVGYVPDTADRVATVQNITAGTNYATLQYTAPSGLYKMTTGNGAIQQVSWNDRQQPTSLIATSGSTNLLTLGFYPCTSQSTSCSTGNTGNVQSQKISFPAVGSAPALNVTQTYSYDNLNRLTSAQETGGTGGWTQNYNQDLAGNHWVSYSSSTLPALTLETPQAPTWYSASSVPNRISGWSYDSAGNVLQVGGMARNFTYDAENRQVTATIGSAMATYAFDGDGLRVSKTAGVHTTVYVYDAWGQLAAEYSTNAEASQCGTPTCYPVVDHLGSTRMLTDNTGSTNVRRYDYQPFGTEILAGVDSRTSSMGYVASTPDDTNPKFTGQNRDAETADPNTGTSLDWFQARFLSGAQGRFQSPDPGNAGANPADPQTWNMYSYVGNNPLSLTDPSGECWWCTLLGVGLDIAGFFTGGATTVLGTILTTGGTVLTGGSLGSDLGGVLGVGGGSDPWTGCGGPLGGCGGIGNDPWSEQSPIGPNVQDPGRFITDWQNQTNSDSWTSQFGLDPYGTALKAVGTFSSGAADFLTLNRTKRLNQWDGGAAAVDYNSRIYTAGKVTGVGLTIATAVAGGATAAAVADGKNGAYFGRGTASVFNSGKVRFGWGWKGTAATGRDVIRLGIGSARGTSWWSHIIFWYP